MKIYEFAQFRRETIAKHTTFNGVSQSATKRCLRVLAVFTACIVLNTCGAEGGGFFATQPAVQFANNVVPITGCLLPAEPESVQRSSGILDIVSGSRSYFLHPLWQNNMPATQPLDEQPERNIISVNRVQVELDLGNIPSTGVDGDLLKFEEIITGIIRPGGGTLSTSVPIIPAELTRSLNIDGVQTPRILATFRMIFEQNGKELATRYETFSVDIVKNSLIWYVSTPEEAAAATVTGNPCGRLQDAGVVCTPLLSNLPLADPDDPLATKPNIGLFVRTDPVAQSLIATNSLPLACYQTP